MNESMNQSINQALL